MNFPHPLMAPVVELALKAGEAILPFWRTGTAVTAKSDDSPVTAADLAAHHLILAGLTALDPALVAGGPAGRHQGVHQRQ
jgi:3'(2'), 5'-bisphosphate nucleotidase